MSTTTILELLFLPILFVTIIAFSLDTVIGLFWLLTLGVLALCFWQSLAINVYSSSSNMPPSSPPSSVVDAPPSYTVVMEAEEGLPSYAQVMGEVEAVEEEVVRKVEGAYSYTLEFLKSSRGSPSPDTA